MGARLYFNNGNGSGNGDGIDTVIKETTAKFSAFTSTQNTKVTSYDMWKEVTEYWETWIGLAASIHKPQMRRHRLCNSIERTVAECQHNYGFMLYPMPRHFRPSVATPPSHPTIRRPLFHAPRHRFDRQGRTPPARRH